MLYFHLRLRLAFDSESPRGLQLESLSVARAVAPRKRRLPSGGGILAKLSELSRSTQKLRFGMTVTAPSRGAAAGPTLRMMGSSGWPSIGLLLLLWATVAVTAQQVMRQK